MLKFFFVLATAVLASLVLYVDADEQDCAGSSTTHRETYISAVTGYQRKYTVYLPPCYQSGQDSFPLLILLHGSDSTDRLWQRLGFLDALDSAIQAGKANPMIVLMPYGSSVANENRFDDTSYDKVLLELLERMNQDFRLNGMRAIGGISRGGFWAYHLGFRYAEDFVAIGGHSAFFDRYHVEAENNPLNLAQGLNQHTHLRLWLDRGTADSARLGTDQMQVILQKGRVPHEYVIYAGGEHNEESWSGFIDDYLAFYSEAFSNPRQLAQMREEDRLELWLPAVGFGTLLTSLDSADLNALLNGEYDQRLLLSESAAERLGEFGYQFHKKTPILSERQLSYVLWSDKRSFTLLPFDALHLRLRPLWVDNLPVVDQLERYPLVFESDAPNFNSEKLTRITLSGTTALTRKSLPAIDAIGLEAATSGIRDYVSLSDFFHVTNEASIAATCPEQTNSAMRGAHSMCMKQEHLPLFDLLDVDVIDLTGNHINDFGFEALNDTLTAFQQRGMMIVGGGQSRGAARSPLIFEHNGTVIGWLACNALGPHYALATDQESPDGPRPGAAYCGGGWLPDALQLLAGQVDVVLMTVHYEEFEAYLPSPMQRFDYQTWAEWGADVVIGTAEHKPMTVEFYPTSRGETAFLHYGLGNLFFDQQFWGNMRFFMDTLYIYDGNLLAVELFTGIIEDQARPRLLAGDDLFNFLHFMFIQKNEF